MIDLVINGVCASLDALYSEYSIYTDTVEQGLDPPCFFVHDICSTSLYGIFGCVGCDTQIEVVYFPQSEHEKNTEMNAMLPILSSALREITAGGTKQRGYEISGRIIDDVLHVFATYRVFVNGINTAETMQNLKYEGGLNG